MKIKVLWATRCLAAGLAFLITAGSTPAAAADVKFGGVVHGQYGMFTSRTNSSGTPLKGKSEFDITRIYIGADAKFSPTVKAKVTLESNGTQVIVSSDAHKANSVFLKNAFVTWTPLESLSFDAGMISMPWISYEEKIWGRRFVQKTYLDQQGTLTSTDKGIGVLYTIPKGYGDLHAVYVNGEGYNVQEPASGSGRYKDAAMRVSITPVPENEWVGGVKLHMFVQNGQTGSGEARRRDRYVGGISYQGSKGHLMFSAMKAYSGNNVSNIDNENGGAAGLTAWSNNVRVYGHSLHGSYKVCKTASVFGRFDRFSTAALLPNTTTGVPNKDTDSFNRGIIGVDYKLAEGVTISLNDQWLTPSNRPSAKASAAGTAMRQEKNNENQILLQFEAKF